MTSQGKPKRIPIWLKVAFSALFLVTIPANTINYTAVNLLWFCDIAIILTFFGLWFESRLLLSMSALSSVAVQLVWQIDYFFRLLSGNSLFRFSDYMFDPSFPLTNHIISLFHVWMPYMSLYALYKVRYDPRAWLVQGVVGCFVIILSYLLTSDMFGPAGNLNKVYGPSDASPQTWMHPWLWIGLVMIYFSVGICGGSHFVFRRAFR